MSLNNMIYGTRKLSLVDYPGQPSLVLFLGGCNFRCPFCHNDSIVKKEANEYTFDYVKSLIEERIHFIGAVVVTGGEPTLYGDNLILLLQELRKFPLQIKLDSNGSNPTLLKKIIDNHLVDYIAMDIKNTFEKYEETAGVSIDIEAIRKSISLLEDSGISYEFRTTINKKMHTEKDIMTIQSYLKNPSKLILQPYSYNENQIVPKDFGEFTKEELKQIEASRDLTVRA